MPGSTEKVERRKSKANPTHKKKTAEKTLTKYVFLYFFYIFWPNLFVGWLALGYDVRRFRTLF